MLPSSPRLRLPFPERGGYFLIGKPVAEEVRRNCVGCVCWPVGCPWAGPEPLVTSAAASHEACGGSLPPGTQTHLLHLLRWSFFLVCCSVIEGELFFKKRANSVSSNFLQLEEQELSPGWGMASPPFWISAWALLCKMSSATGSGEKCCVTILNRYIQ